MCTFDNGTRFEDWADAQAAYADHDEWDADESDDAEGFAHVLHIADDSDDPDAYDDAEGFAHVLHIADDSDDPDAYDEAEGFAHVLRIAGEVADRIEDAGVDGERFAVALRNLTENVRRAGAESGARAMLALGLAGVLTDDSDMVGFGLGNADRLSAEALGEATVSERTQAEDLYAEASAFLANA